MTEYERFQQIMADINHKIQKEEAKNKASSFDLPEGFEELFSKFKK